MTHIVLDSRSVTPNSIFIAIKGSKVDGNNFALEAIKRGASLAVVNNNINVSNKKLLKVNNTIDALKRLGKYSLNRSKLSLIVGITGSCGKTTTREWISKILSHKYNICSSIKNYNTMLSLPVCLSSIKYSDNIGIFELGTSKPGEIIELTKYIKPYIGIITNIYPAHIGNFKNIKELAIEKISIIKGIRRDGILICDGNSKFKYLIKETCLKYNINPIFVGFDSNCDYFIKDYNNGNICIETKNKLIRYHMKNYIKHQVYISACIIALIDSLKLNVDEFIPYFGELESIEGRGKHKKYKYNDKIFTVIDESYNANPFSVNAALDTLENIKTYNRKIFIFGQMNELGNYTEKYHKDIIERVSKMDIYQTYFIGNKELCNIMRAYNNIKCFYYLDSEAIDKILQTVQDGDVILVKGSRSIALERFFVPLKCCVI